MNVEKLASELMNTFWRSNGDSGMSWLAVARRAVELLANKPVATRDAAAEVAGGYVLSGQCLMSATASCIQADIKAMEPPA